MIFVKYMCLSEIPSDEDGATKPDQNWKVRFGSSRMRYRAQKYALTQHSQRSRL